MNYKNKVKRINAHLRHISVQLQLNKMRFKTLSKIFEYQFDRNE